MFCSRTISGSTNHYICHWITCNVRLNFCFLMILFWSQKKIKARKIAQEREAVRKMSTFQKPNKPSPKKSITFIVVYHMLKWFAYCYFRWNFPLHFQSLQSLLLLPTHSALLLWKRCRTRSKGNKALNKKY